MGSNARHDELLCRWPFASTSGAQHGSSMPASSLDKQRFLAILVPPVPLIWAEQSFPDHPSSCKESEPTLVRP